MSKNQFRRLALFVAILIMVSQFNGVDARSINSSEDEVSLIVSGDGLTKDDATKVALRSAIEQAFGTFVSSNTQILNDELVKDEIVTVSSGNIKKYDYISETYVSGKYHVTLNATVSIGKLITYAKSKAYPLQKSNWNGKLICNKEKEGKVNDGYVLTAYIKVLATPTTSEIYSLIQNTLNSLKISMSELDSYLQLGKYLYNYNYRRPANSRYEIKDEDILLPFSEINKIREYDEELNKKMFCAFLNYKLVDLSNPNYYLTWRHLKISDKALVVQNGHDSRFVGGISSIKEDISHYLWLVDSNGESFKPLYLYSSGQLDLNSRLYIRDGGWFNGRIDRNTNWSQWILPKINKANVSMESKESKKSKKKKDKVTEKPILEYADVEQIICEYSIPIFISKDKMSSFGGFSIEKNTNQLIIR